MKISKVLTSIIVSCPLLLNSVLPVHAAKFFISGKTDSEALGVTLLIVDSQVQPSDLKSKDIYWIDQQKVDSEGRFSVEIPEFDSSLYKMYSNANNFETGEEKSKTVYVSSTGTGTGETADSSASLSDVLYRINMIKEIVLVDDITFSETNLPGDVTIKGNTPGVKLTLSSAVNLTGSLKIDNLSIGSQTTFYANGYDFEITDSVTSKLRLTVYGGGNGKTVQNTNIKLNGGLYQNIYGGGYNAAVNGDTNVVLGGNANTGDGINDANDNKLSPCKAYGGGNNGSVNGKTNITLAGNAVSQYVIGAGAGTNGTAKDTNVFITGGKVMNVYGGSLDANLPSGVKTNITMTGGLAEALFGGCYNRNMTGSTQISLLGGEVTRRVYTGCYNETEGTLTQTFKSDYFITGSTTLIIAPGVSVNTKNGLSGTNNFNVGLFSGSRTAAQHDAEKNTIIYLDDCYTKYRQTIGEKGFLFTGTFKSFADYVVKASTGGDVFGTATGGAIEFSPDSAKYASLNSGTKAYFNGDTAVLNTGENTVTFADVLTASKTESGVNATATVPAADSAVVMAAVYDMSNNLVGVTKTKYIPETDTYNINVNCVLESGKSYMVKLYMWDNMTAIKPLMEAYQLTIK